ncbi:MAG: ATPase [Lachnospiraceae bacterium]|nr:ATPase [Lachnospiraceae bacterium]
MSKIENIIAEMEDYIESCRFQPLSNTKIIVNKDQMEEYLSELRLKTPDEIKKYQRIIDNREAILSDAQKKADAMLREAQIQTSELISEHEIMQQAYIQANEVIQNATNEAQAILDQATMEANAVKMGAMQYTDEILANVQNLLSYSAENFQTKFDSFMASVNKSLEIVVANREELRPEEETPAEEQPAEFEDYTVNINE